MTIRATAISDLECITELCRLHRPPLALIIMHSPVGNPNGEHLDALVETEDGRGRFAVEVTLCYRGDRASGEAKLEEGFIEYWSAWLREVAISCLGTRGYRVTYTIYQTVGLTELVPRIKEFLRSPHDQEHVRSAVTRALRTAEQDRKAAMIADAERDVSPLFRWASQVYVQLTAPTAPTIVQFKFEEPVSDGRDGQWQTPIPKVFWTDPQALMDAVADKRAKLGRYRRLAEASGAHALWLLLVVEESCAWDLAATLRGEHSQQLRSTFAASPHFDEIYVLAKGPWLPDGWDFKRDGLDYAGGPIWKLVRVWPLAQTSVV